MLPFRQTGETTIVNHRTAEKKQHLITLLREHAPLAVALSGGVDSSFLLSAAHAALGDQVVAFTSVSPLHAARERRTAALVAATIGVRQVELPSRRLEVSAFTDNPENRCYVCKKNLWAEFLEAAARLDVPFLADGLCLDDLDDFRPGIAAGREMGVLSPLVSVGLGKGEIIALAREAGLSVWDKPSNACLATRIPYGTRITVEKLAMIEAAESLLIESGFSLCRVRCHGDLARIEVAADNIGRLTETDARDRIVRELRRIGFSRVAVDLSGYGAGGPDIS